MGATRVCILSLIFLSLISHNAFFPPKITTRHHDGRAPPPTSHDQSHPNSRVYKVLVQVYFDQKTTNIKPLWIHFGAKSLETP